MEKIVIIGSHSFSGSHFVHHALSQGLTVLGISYVPKKSMPFTPYHWKVGSAHRLTLKQLSLGAHPDNAISMINDYNPDYIIHCMGDVQLDFHDQLKNQPLKYVSVSSLKENCYQRNTTTKTSSVVIAPMSHVYGPGQQVHELIPKIILSILSEKKFLLHDGGHTKQAFIHINDITAGIFRVVYEGVPGEIYHFSNNHLISVRDLVSLICNRLNVSFEDVVTLIGDHQHQNKEELLESTQYHHDLSWQPTIELERGIDTVIAWAQEWLPALKNHSIDLGA